MSGAPTDAELAWREAFVARCAEALEARVMRERRHISYDTLRDEMEEISGEKINRSTVYRWLTGDSTPPISRLPLIARVLGVSQIWLAFGQDEALPPVPRRRT